HDFGPMERRALFHDASLHDARIGLGVALDDVYATHDDPIPLLQNAFDFAAFALVLAGDDEHGVVLLNTGQAHRTSGASDTIFMKLRSRSSRATGPKMRVPRGLFWVVRSTAALSSKRI